ncbi:DUF4240 domain-containing protein [Actinomadura sp. HBU206391]|uniref:DUF4240 domain-containing protein n=1 Tax=Actinomadura sp. HBU206391 TaxID=2731692 RepID=UPI0016501A70|nr:DUF4240 domain-containing protein [Actinomadura sp. HBU206391]MBC6457719.1 DUF4240 domain-containing protein [Actinomadura sp. HBU206391]
MNTEEFWDIVESARTGDKPFYEALVDRLAVGPEQAILEFEYRFDQVTDAVYRWDVWAAAYLIGGGCSDDGFMDFQAGLVALGRDWFEKAARSPDDLADHPAVIEAAAGSGSGSGSRGDSAIFYEEVGAAGNVAYERLTGAGADAYEEAWDRYQDGREDEEEEPDMGEEFDFDDADQMRKRLPRLSALFLSPPAL